ncbi:arsenic resistance N-acetyltransferase ArsN2 [Haloferacaceae archaeon DSL9]
MGDRTVTLQSADDERALSAVERLLSDADLPSQDIRSSPAVFYLGYIDDDAEAVGAGGIEQYGSDGLLRSVVVERSVRGAGVGTALCDALEARAAATGVDDLYLLTTTATGFFADRGYAELPRTAVSETIRRTTEFVLLCPETAVCMRKSIVDDR